MDPATNAVADGVDSIPLTGEGNAGFATVGGDGLLYVMNSGSFSSGEGRLSIVDPVGRTELASFAGFGTGPGNVASDGEAKIYVSSYAEGLMEFDTDSNKVVRGAGNGVAIPLNAAVAVDSKHRIYAIDSGPCWVARSAWRTCSTRPSPRSGPSRSANARWAPQWCRFRPNEARARAWVALSLTHAPARHPGDRAVGASI